MCMDKTSKKPSKAYLYFKNGEDVKGPKKKASEDFAKRVYDWLKTYVDWDKIIQEYKDKHPEEFK